MGLPMRWCRAYSVCERWKCLEARSCACRSPVCVASSWAPWLARASPGGCSGTLGRNIPTPQPCGSLMEVRRRETSVSNTHPSKHQRSRSHKATRKPSAAGSTVRKGKRETPIGNASEPSSTYFLAESSDKGLSAQYLRPNIQPIYHNKRYS